MLPRGARRSLLPIPAGHHFVRCATGLAALIGLLAVPHAVDAQHPRARPAALLPGLPAPTSRALASAQRRCPASGAPTPGGAAQLYQPPPWLLRGRGGPGAVLRNTGPIRQSFAIRESTLAQTSPRDPGQTDARLALAEDMLDAASVPPAGGATPDAATLRSHARRLLRAIIEAQPSYARRDEALAEAARLEADVGNDTEARSLWFALIRDYPQSRFVPQAYWSFGQFFVQQGAPANAEEFFQRAATTGGRDDALWGPAVYYLAWTARSQGSEPRARGLYLAVLDRTRQSPPPPDAAALESAALEGFCAAPPPSPTTGSRPRQPGSAIRPHQDDHRE